MHKRYGKFQVTDYTSLWLSFIIFCIMIVLGVYVDLSILYLLIPISYSIILIYSICSIHRECFEIVDDIIIIGKGKKQYKKYIPEEITLIISYADICNPLCAPSGRICNPQVLKGKYGLSIFIGMNMEDVIKKIRKNKIKRNTMSTIKAAFEEYQFIYSFVCDENLLNEIIKKRKVNLLVPKSLLDKISLNAQMGTIYIDPKC